MLDDITIQIQVDTRNYVKARNQLAERLQTLEDDQQSLLRRKLPGIKTALARTQDAEASLRNLISANPGKFKRPKTMTIEGVKVGFQKSKGKLSFEDAATVCALIKKKLPNQADTLIKTTEKPVKTALQNLSGVELKAIGCTLSEDQNAVIVKPQDSELEKLITKILDENNEPEETEE